MLARARGSFYGTGFAYITSLRTRLIVMGRAEYGHGSPVRRGLLRRCTPCHCVDLAGSNGFFAPARLTSDGVYLLEAHPCSVGRSDSLYGVIVCLKVTLSPKLSRPDTGNRTV